MAPIPHHDGSPLYVSDSTPALGQVVRVRVRMPQACPYEGVRMLSVSDADIHMEPLRLIASGSGERWFEGSLPMHNPVTSYRFMLLRRGGGFDWLNATGVWSHEVTDADDFRLTVFPSSPQWNVDGAVYQIFPDRFARSLRYGSYPVPRWAVPTAWARVPSLRGPMAGREWYGGDLDGIRSHLDHIQDMGFSVVYLTPFFPAGSVHRYDASSFDHVDPLLGGDEALNTLACACHDRGMRLMGDLTLNHTGSGHEWFHTAREDSDSPERGFYMWREYPDDYVAWMDVPSLPKLNWESQALLDRMVRGPRSVAGRWLGGKSGLDGWRIDVANQTGRYGADDFNHDVAVAIRRTVEERTGGDGALIAEYMQDPSHDLAGDGWQGVMNYAGFSRPVWTWLCDPGNSLEYMGLGVHFCRRDGVDTVRSMREFLAHIPWKVALSHWNNLDSHDTARIRTLIGDERLVRVAIGLLMTFPGVPMMFAGDEQGAVGSTGEQSRVTMDWESPRGRYEETSSIYRELLDLRRRYSCLRTGGLRWTGATADALGYLREDEGSRLLVTASRIPGGCLTIDAGLIGEKTPRLLFGEAGVRREGDHWLLTMPEPATCIWRLEDFPLPRW